jgi:hypothetical protein
MPSFHIFACQSINLSEEVEESHNNPERLRDGFATENVQEFESEQPVRTTI